MLLAESGLRHASEILPKGVCSSRAFVISKSIPEAIVNDASRSSADLIVCGVANVSHKFLPKGLSTVLSLMANAPIPVIAFPPGASFQKSNEDAFRIILADDLEDAGASAAKFGIEWAKSIGKSSIYHVHVNTSRKEDFIASAYATMGPDYIPVSLPYDPVEMYEQYRSSLISVAALVKGERTP